MMIRKKFADRDFVLWPQQHPIFPWIWYWGFWIFEFV
jgi:hypothetical protein